jgi:hypothetical protein
MTGMTMKKYRREKAMDHMRAMFFVAMFICLVLVLSQLLIARALITDV